MYLVDISNFVGTFTSMMLTGVNNTFSFLDSISFYGFTLLDFSLSVLILPAILSIILSASKSQVLASRFEARHKSKKEE